jgi:glycine/D-amino acid oxidase-like deaminating enzyme
LSIRDHQAFYESITADKIVFCDGIASMNYEWFNLLPFSPNKGEVLLIESKDLNNEHIFKQGLMLAPLFEDNIFWVGSSYQWQFEHGSPTPEFLEKTKAVLNKWLKVPYKVIDHRAAVRPATLERRPFVGFHPQHTSIGILNGMGTKGTSLAPFFANQLAQHICFDAPIMPEADVKRFSRILSK